VDDQALIELFLEERGSRSIPLHPANDMLACGKMIGLCAVTSSVSQNEVVTKVDGISWPRNKVVNVRCSRRDLVPQ